MQERKRKQLLRAAVGMALLGAVAVPAETEAIRPYLSWNGSNYVSYSYDGDFVWSSIPDNSPDEIKLTQSLGTDGDTLENCTHQIFLTYGFYARNASSGYKVLTDIRNFYGKSVTLTGLSLSHSRVGWGNCKVDGEGMRAYRVITQEDTQNGVKLSQDQQHQIWA